MLTQAPKGTRDILPSDIYKWHYLEKTFSKVCENFGYNEIRFPVFEHTELFQRGVGDTTDIVQKEMYTFNDKSGRSISLRPEGTASVVRGYIENGMSSLSMPVKLFYNISAYRYEKMQKGRLREFHQFGVEAFGSVGPLIDVEIISMLDCFYKKIGLCDIQLNINSIGCPRCRKIYNEKLKECLNPNLDNLCQTCNTRYQKNPLRILDCKEERCKEYTKDAPSLIEYLCKDCLTHFEELKKGLTSLGIGYNIDKNIVRGLDYYTKTVFEFISTHIGSQGTVCGGGRYDGLVFECGGQDTPGIGFALGVERTLLVMEAQNIEIAKPESVDIFIATLGDKAVDYVQKLAYNLRLHNISVEVDLMNRSLKAQMKYADKKKVHFCLVIGDEELDKNKGIIKNMSSSEQTEVELNFITIKSFLRNN